MMTLLFPPPPNSLKYNISMNNGLIALKILHRGEYGTYGKIRAIMPKYDQIREA